MEHLHRYASEFQFKWNHRKAKDISALVIAALIGTASPYELHFRPFARVQPGHPPATKIAGATFASCYDEYLSGLGLRAAGGCKPRQVRKEATVAVRFVCRGSPGAWHLPSACTR